MRRFIILIILVLIVIPALATSSLAGGDSYSSYIRSVQSRIAERVAYPQKAGRESLEGVVKLRLRISGDGRLRDLSIYQSSGHKLLDEAARDSVFKASPYPVIPPELNLSEILMQIPIVYTNTRKQISRRVSDETRFKSARSKNRSLEFLSAPFEESEPNILFFALPRSAELESFIELAVKNDQSMQIVRQEIGLAQLKSREARRNLLPGLKVEVYNTEGETSNIEYAEREIKFQLDQPVYYGGRLKDTFSQTRVNSEITRKNYSRLMIDVAHKAEVAYYNLVASRMNLKIQEKILQEAKSVLDVVQKQLTADLITPLEAAGAQSAYDQVIFQISNTKQDMAMAELTLKQVLNVSELPEITREQLEITRFDFDLSRCLEAGLKNRPEIRLSELLIEFNQYGKKIEKAKNKFTVDFTTFYGRYEGAFVTESMSSANNWYAGIKATKPWGASTLNTSITTEETQPRFGETSSTQASTIKAELRLLDNLKHLSEGKKAEIELQRSLNDLNETTKTIVFEVRNAYLNYQRALLQSTTAQSQTEFRRQEVNILKVRAQVGEVGFASIMETLVSLLRAQTESAQALANYFISLTNLKKATGYVIKI